MVLAVFVGGTVVATGDGLVTVLEASLPLTTYTVLGECCVCEDWSLIPSSEVRSIDERVS